MEDLDEQYNESIDRKIPSRPCDAVHRGFIDPESDYQVPESVSLLGPEANEANSLAQAAWVEFLHGVDQ